MGIFRAIGLGLVIIILKFLMPVVFAGLENTLVVFFDTTQSVLLRSQAVVQTGSVIPNVGYLIPH